MALIQALQFHLQAGHHVSSGSDIVVFLGPSLTRAAAIHIADFDYRPPAAQGEIASAVLDQPNAIALIDGAFGQVPSVWHKEILWALDQGIAVHGAASLGALRAAELHTLGMQGHGWIYEQFASGRLSDDDEVAVVHAPTELGWSCLSDSMVDIRRTLDQALCAGIASTGLIQDFTNSAKALPFAARSYGRVSEIVRARHTPGEVDRLTDWIAFNAIGQKRQDTIDLLVHLKNAGGRSSQSRTGRQFIPTVHWANMFGIAPNGGILGPLAKQILDELRLRPDLLAKLEDAAIPSIMNMLKDELASRGLILDSRSSIRRLCRNSLEAAIFRVAVDSGIAARFQSRAAAKLALLRSAPGHRTGVGRWQNPIQLRRAWMNAHFASLSRMGMTSADPAQAAILLGFDSLNHFDAVLALDREIGAIEINGGRAMPNIGADSQQAPRWATWIYMASENDPNEPSLDFEAAAQANIDQVQSRMPFQRSEYFITSDRRNGPAFLHLFGSTAKPKIPGDEAIKNNFAQTDNVAEFIVGTLGHKQAVPNKRMLILWGHGKGMLFLSNPGDEGKPTSRKDVQNVVDFTRSMRKSLAQLTFDILGLDCCFMAHLETLYEMRALAHRIVAGPSEIPASSWPYDNIATLLEDEFGDLHDDQAVAEGIAAAARESFVEMGELDSPVLVFTTERLEAAISALNALGFALTEKINFENPSDPLLAAVVGARRGARGHYNAPDYVELESLLKGVIDRLGNPDTVAQLARSAINKTRDSLERPAPIRGGAAPRSPTIWFPLHLPLYSEACALYDTLQASRLHAPQGGVSGWAKFLRKFHGDPKKLGESVTPDDQIKGSALQIGVRGFTQSI